MYGEPIRFKFVVSFLFAAFLFCLQRFFFVCSASFLFAAIVFCLQRIFFVCSNRFLFAACPLWAIVRSIPASIFPKCLLLVHILLPHCLQQLSISLCLQFCLLENAVQIFMKLRGNFVGDLLHLTR